MNETQKRINKALVNVRKGIKEHFDPTVKHGWPLSVDSLSTVFVHEVLGADAWGLIMKEASKLGLSVVFDSETNDMLVVKRGREKQQLAACRRNRAKHKKGLK